jgi:hypothetical protein
VRCSGLRGHADSQHYPRRDARIPLHAHFASSIRRSLRNRALDVRGPRWNRPSTLQIEGRVSFPKRASRGERWREERLPALPLVWCSRPLITSLVPSTASLLHARLSHFRGSARRLRESSALLGFLLYSAYSTSRSHLPRFHSARSRLCSTRALSAVSIPRAQATL